MAIHREIGFNPMVMPVRKLNPARLAENREPIGMGPLLLLEMEPGGGGGTTTSDFA